MVKRDNMEQSFKETLQWQKIGIVSLILSFDV